MTISLAKAISCIKEDEKWISKIIIGGVIGFIIPFVIGLLFGLLGIEEKTLEYNLITYAIGFIFGGFISGFIFTTMNKTLNSTEKFQMVNWSDKNLLLKGIKAIFAFLVWSFIAIIIFVLFTTLTAAIISLICTLLGQALSLDSIVQKNLILLVNTLIGIIVGLYFVQFVNNAYACYIKTLKLEDMLAFKKQFRMIKENQHLNWSLIGKNILFVLLACLVTSVLIVTIVGILLLPFVFFAMNIVAYNLITQYAKTVEINKYFEN